MIYVLVSGTFEMMDTTHKGVVLGQEFDLTDEQAQSAILAGAHLLPKATFDTFGFTPEEIAKHSNAQRQTNAPADFRARHAAAIQAAKKHQEDVAKALKESQGAAPKPPVAPPAPAAAVSKLSNITMAGVVATPVPPAPAAATPAKGAPESPKSSEVKS